MVVHLDVLLNSVNEHLKNCKRCKTQPLKLVHTRTLGVVSCFRICCAKCDTDLETMFRNRRRMKRLRDNASRNNANKRLKANNMRFDIRNINRNIEELKITINQRVIRPLNDNNQHNKSQTNR